MSAPGGAEIYIRWNVLLDTSCINKEKCSLMSLRVLDRSRERKALILWENPSPSKMGVMVVVIVLHEGEIPHHH